MVAKWADANPGELPDEFKGDTANFVKSWKELRGHATKLSQENAELKKGGDGGDGEGGEGKDGVGKGDGKGSGEGVEPKGLFIADGDEKPAEGEGEVKEGIAAVNWKEVASSYVPGTGFPAETKTGLAAKGVPDDVIASFEAGQDALQRERLREAALLVNGEKNLAAITSAASKLPAERRAQLNAALAADGWQTVLVGLQAELMTGQTIKGEPGEIDTVTGEPTASRPWGDQAEMVAAMKDPRYKTSPDYRDEVARRCRLNADTKKTK